MARTKKTPVADSTEVTTEQPIMETDNKPTDGAIEKTPSATATTTQQTQTPSATKVTTPTGQVPEMEKVDLSGADEYARQQLGTTPDAPAIYNKEEVVDIDGDISTMIENYLNNTESGSKATIAENRQKNENISDALKRANEDNATEVELKNAIGENRADNINNGEQAIDPYEEALMTEASAQKQVMNDVLRNWEDKRKEYERTTQAEEKQMKRRNILAGLTEAASSIVNLIGTAKQGTNMKIPEYTKGWMEEAERQRKENKKGMEDIIAAQQKAQQNAMLLKAATKKSLAEYKKQKEALRLQNETARQKMAFEKYKTDQQNRLKATEMAIRANNDERNYGLGVEKLKETERHNKVSEHIAATKATQGRSSSNPDGVTMTLTYFPDGDTSNPVHIRVRKDSLRSSISTAQSLVGNENTKKRIRDAKSEQERIDILIADIALSGNEKVRQLLNDLNLDKQKPEVASTDASTTETTPKAENATQTSNAKTKVDWVHVN